MNLNKVQIIGRITRDPEMKAFNSGVSVCNFSVATNRIWKNQDGQKQEEVEYHKCTAFGKVGEVIGKFTKKGSIVYLEGRLSTKSWEDKTSGERYATEIVVEKVELPPKSLSVGLNYEDGLDSTAPTKEEIKGKGMDLETLDYGEVIDPDDIPF
jgi:single-strand DNA-binding protein